jgi:hypothetical protein
MSARDVVTEIVQNPRIASAVASLTTGTGVGTILDLIPDDIGKLATLVGIVLSTVLIYTHWRKGRIEYEKTRLEILLLKQKEAERVEAARLGSNED